MVGPGADGDGAATAPATSQQPAASSSSPGSKPAGAMPKLPPRGASQAAATSTSSSAANGSGAAHDTAAASQAGSSSTSTGAGITSAASPGAPKASNGPSLPPRPGAKGSAAGAPSAASSSQPTAGAGGSSGSSGNSPGAGAQGPAPSTSMPHLPPRQGAGSGSGAAAGLSSGNGPGPAGAEASEPESVKEVRRLMHTIRVQLLRAAQRLGYPADNALVRQVLYRLQLAEKLRAPWKRGAKRIPDPATVAAREAAKLEAATGGSTAPLGFCVKMMLIGPAGGGKTQLVHALLGGSDWQAVDPINGATKGVQVVKGSAQGVDMLIVDTPGMVVAASGAADNARVVQQIRSAYRKHKPDLVVYVDRLDTGGGPSGGAELPALRSLSEALGGGCWLNTIVALSHAGASPPMGSRGLPLPFEQWASTRSHALQQVIRAASGDGRLMNPMAYVESHPKTCVPGPGGEPLLPGSELAWRRHLLLMVVSAKLLADTENMLQMCEDGSSGNAAAAAAAQQQLMAQLMGGTGRSLPLPYLCTQATQFSRPLKYPEHHQIMQVRHLEASAKAATHPRQRKQLVLQAKALALQMKQAEQYKDKMQRSFRNATLAGSKVTPEPPRLATKRPPSTVPPVTFRYRVPEPSGGWVVRPQIEPHGIDNTDGVEGLQMEQTGVLGRRRKVKRAKGSTQVVQEEELNLLGGVPMHHYLTAQAAKGTVMLQGRSEATLYADPLGTTTTSLSADLQTTGTPGAPLDALVTVRADVRRKRTIFKANKATAGVLVSRLIEGGRPQKGPVALGLRLQDTFSGSLGSSLPVEVAAAGAVLTAPWGSGGAAPGEVGVGEAEVCMGGNMELTADVQEMLGTRHSTPVALSMSAVAFKGEVMNALGASMQVRGKRKDVCAARVQFSNKGRAGLNVKVHSGKHWWSGLVAMVVPLGYLLVDFVGSLRSA